VKKDDEREAELVLWTICRDVELAVDIERDTTPEAIRMCQIPP
jgi:hypothetical protein